jgi:hypothetical protein
MNIILFILFASPSLFSQDSLISSPVKVGNIEWNIAQRENWKAGITREPALRRYYNISLGSYYESKEKLEALLDITTRDLNAQQIYSEISYEVEYYEDDILAFSSTQNERQNPIQIAHITISVKDAFSLYLLPYVLYDSNLGTVFGGNFSYNNVLGTLTNLDINGYWGMETWKVGGQWENVSLGLMRGDLILFDEFITTKRVDDQDQTVLEYSNMILDFSLVLKFPLGKGFTLSLKPGINLPYNYELISYDPDYGRDEFDNREIITSVSLAGGISYSSVYWEEQFRKGLEGELILTGKGPGSNESIMLACDGSASLFYRTFSFLGLGHNISAFYIFDGNRNNAGRYIRGVLDHLMFGNLGFFLNNNVDFRAFIIPPLVDVHLYPLLDLAYVYNSDTPYDPHDFRMTAGFGLTIYPLFLQSLQLNIEAGFDLKRGSKNEITFKSELFF